MAYSGKLNVGDRVCGFFVSEDIATFEATVYRADDDVATLHRDDHKEGCGEYTLEYGHGWCVRRRGDSCWGADGSTGTLHLITDEKPNKSMNLKESFAIAFKSEPEKSFRKAGITDGDDLLTPDGQQIYLSWLLKSNGSEFKKEVVDDILKQMEKDK